jgi:hypothetical protein
MEPNRPGSGFHLLPTALRVRLPPVPSPWGKEEIPLKKIIFVFDVVFTLVFLVFVWWHYIYKEPLSLLVFVWWHYIYKEPLSLLYTTAITVAILNALLYRW